MSRFGTEFNSSRKRRQSSFLFEMMTICVTLFVVSMVLLDFTLVQAANQAAGFAAVSEPSSQQFLLPNNGHLRARRSLASGRWGLRPGKRSFWGGGYASSDQTAEDGRPLSWTLLRGIGGSGSRSLQQQNQNNDDNSHYLVMV